jgi:hypothetical protein
MLMPYADKKSPKAVASQKLSRKRYYWNNRERQIAIKRQWAIDNPDRVCEVARAAYARRTIEQKLWHSCQQRARRDGIEFTITLADVVVPEFCPVFGYKLESGAGFGSVQRSSPTVDRIDNSRGYVPGNVQVISHRANTIKSNATAEELERLLVFMRRT